MYVRAVAQLLLDSYNLLSPLVNLVFSCSLLTGFFSLVAYLWQSLTVTDAHLQW